MRTFLTTLACCAVSVALLQGASCATTQSGGGGDINVTLRRIDVLEADYDAMKLAIVLGVDNGTGSDASVSASGSIALIGEAKDADGDDGAGGDDGSEGGDETEEKADEEVATEGSVDKPIDGKRHSGSASGVAVANNTSELLLTIDVPLPADAATLEPMLSWGKMAVHVEGTVKVGLKEIRIGGIREVAPPHLPDVKLKESQVASENDGQGGAAFFTVLLDNKNPFAVTVDKLSFTITIKDKQLQAANGNTEVVNDDVPASAVAEYQVEVLLNEAAFGKELKALLRQPTVPYVVEGTLHVRGIEKPFKFSGDMKFAR